MYDICSERISMREGKMIPYLLLYQVLAINVRAVLCLVVQLCPILCNTMDCSPPGSSFHGIPQARILEWVAIPFSRRYLPDPEVELGSPALQADSLPSEPPGKAINVYSFFWILGRDYISIKLLSLEDHGTSSSIIIMINRSVFKTGKNIYVQESTFVVKMSKGAKRK